MTVAVGVRVGRIMRGMIVFRMVVFRMVMRNVIMSCMICVGVVVRSSFGCDGHGCPDQM
jgi:hypothetical protein